MDIAGKTGTTNDYVDARFCGLQPGPRRGAELVGQPAAQPQQRQRPAARPRYRSGSTTWPSRARRRAAESELPRPDGLIRVQNGLGTSQDWQYAGEIRSARACRRFRTGCATCSPTTNFFGDGGRKRGDPARPGTADPAAASPALSRAPARLKERRRCRVGLEQANRSRDGDSRRSPAGGTRDDDSAAAVAGTTQVAIRHPGRPPSRSSSAAAASPLRRTARPPARRASPTARDHRGC